MKAREKFIEIRNRKKTLSLKDKFTLSVSAIVVGSIMIAVGISALLKYLIPFLERIPSLVQLSVFGLSISMIATYFLSKAFFEPIKVLRDGMQQVADGKFKTQLETKSTSKEIQEIFAGFNMMTQELNATEILQSDFVSNVSHEFKTPINAIEGYTTLLQSAENTGENEKEYIEKILFNTHRLSSLVSNILLLSKIENQSIATNQNLFRLDEQIREAIVALETEWDAKNIEFDVNLERTEYYGSENMLHHVWSNLIGNAIKFSPENSTVKTFLQSDEKNIVFKVEDEGCGLTEQAKKHIFDKFYQGDPSHKEQGNGLGLALVKKILAIECGTITADNLTEKGCRFTVTLPLKNNI